MILRPRSVEEALAARARGAAFGAGLTALQLGWGPEGAAGEVVDLAALPGLGSIALRDGALHIGALVTLEGLRVDPSLRDGWPQIAALLGLVGALGVRNLGTVGGNIAWGAGDLVPPLTALDAQLHTTAGRVPLTARPVDALILGVELPPAPAFLFVEKVGFRAAFSPSLVTVAAACDLGPEGHLRNVRIALGGGPNRAGRIPAAEALAEGRPPPRLATHVAEVNTVAAAMADAAERRRTAEAQRDLLVRELHHRVKNLLTTAQSLATLSARSASDPQAFAAQFGARLRALARTHTLLLEQPDGVVAVRTLAAEVVAPYRLGVGRIALGGPEVRLPAETAVPLGMVLHELATNAAKYGALSVAEGRLDIAWRLAPAEGAPQLVLEWVEAGGPAPGGPPLREGFGSQLLRRALSGQPGGAVEVMWRPEGLAVRMTVAARGAEIGAAPAEATS